MNERERRKREQRKKERKWMEGRMKRKKGEDQVEKEKEKEKVEDDKIKAADRKQGEPSVRRRCLLLYLIPLVVRFRLGRKWLLLSFPVDSLFLLWGGWMDGLLTWSFAHFVALEQSFALFVFTLSPLFLLSTHRHPATHSKNRTAFSTVDLLFHSIPPYSPKQQK